MIRFGGAIDPTTKACYLLPNDVEHPKFVARPGGKSFWVSCRKEAIERLIATRMLYQLFFCSGSAWTGRYAMVLHDLKAQGQLVQWTEYLLQKRLVQELQLLRDRLQTTPQRMTSLDETLIKQISHQDWEEIRHSDSYALPGVSAILYLSGHVDSMTEDFPFCRLIEDATAMPPRRTVPIYNFTGRLPLELDQQAQRLLQELLQVEANSRKKIEGNSIEAVERDTADKSRLSNAFFVRSTPATLPRADTVPLCIALWRLRLWAGYGWNDGLWGQWESKQPARDHDKE